MTLKHQFWETGLGPKDSNDCASSDASFHDEEPETPRRHMSCIISQEASGSMREGGDEVGCIEKVAVVQGQPLRGFTNEMQGCLDEVLRRLETHDVRILEAVQRLDALEAFRLDGGRDRTSPGCSTPASPQGSLSSDQAKAVILPTPPSESPVGGSRAAQLAATPVSKAPAWKAVLRAELRADVQARGAALEARLAAVETAFQAGLESADARLTRSAIALAGAGAELRSLVPRVHRLEAVAGDSIRQLPTTDASPFLTAEAEPAAEASAAAAAAVRAATGAPVAVTRMQQPVSCSRSVDHVEEAPARYFSQGSVRFPSACAGSHSSEASRLISVPPYKTPQDGSRPTHRPVPVSSWSHEGVPPPLVAAQETTSAVVKIMMDNMGRFGTTLGMSAWTETSSTSAWSTPSVPPATSNARQRRFMDPQGFQGSQQQASHLQGLLQ
mmetsp:Transcript_35366/g.69888  ORF Transcript_35366/g.69888 Transcript_35366/m.69888 type:complete len:442 (+) Transcript_35366:49-1374(+)|eukprot:CAMPEP_0172673756 /NCGR_PEP_ID=MMETSP1074-20121228/12338_1 /TAXON_ID=2916 /ORGANISM="Ceratium fusus, Strain PA161109" /LENGTH=441 /DNA_ID=CAMNT_0013491097 /DNA_START=49 /DNA_END=1374 /DNA_ORIENTATION=+